MSAVRWVASKAMNSLNFNAPLDLRRLDLHNAEVLKMYITTSQFYNDYLKRPFVSRSLPLLARRRIALTNKYRHGICHKLHYTPDEFDARLSLLKIGTSDIHWEEMSRVLSKHYRIYWSEKNKQNTNRHN